MSNKSGRFGAVDNVHGVRDWTMTDQMSTSPFYASNTRAGAGRRPGIKDWSGSFNASGGYPAVMPSEKFTFKGYTAPDNGSYGTTGIVYSGSAICDSFQLNIDWSNNAPLNYAFNFSGNGAWSQGSEAVTDTTSTNDEWAENARILLMSTAASGSLSESGVSGGSYELCARSATLQINAQNPSTANSCSNGYMIRESGPIDWNLSVVVDNEDQDSYPFDIGDLDIIRVYTSASNYWELKWGQFAGFSNLNVNLSGEFISQTLTWEMCATDLTGAIGQIVKPGGASAWWPFTT